MSPGPILINRAPVLTLWAAVVAERMGFDRDAALTLGKGMAGLTAQSRGRHLGIFKPGKGRSGTPQKSGLGEEFWVEICGRSIPARNTKDGVRAVVREEPLSPESVQRYLEQKFGPDLAAARAAFEELARALPPALLADTAFTLYTKFRPSIPAGEAGWGAKGRLDLELVHRLARQTHTTVG